MSFRSVGFFCMYMYTKSWFIYLKTAVGVKRQIGVDGTLEQAFSRLHMYISFVCTFVCKFPFDLVWYNKQDLESDFSTCVCHKHPCLSVSKWHKHPCLPKWHVIKITRNNFWLATKKWRCIYAEPIRNSCHWPSEKLTG